MNDWIQSAAIECRVAAQACYVDGDADYEDIDRIMAEIIEKHYEAAKEGPKP